MCRVSIKGVGKEMCSSDTFCRTKNAWEPILAADRNVATTRPKRIKPKFNVVDVVRAAATSPKLYLDYSLYGPSCVNCVCNVFLWLCYNIISASDILD